MKKQIKILIKKEAILFGKYLANNINTERLDEDDAEKEIPKLYEEFLQLTKQVNESNH